MQNLQNFFDRKNLEFFVKERNDLFNFSSKIFACDKHVVITAPVKSGKKEMVFVQALISSDRNAMTKHVYVTSFYRKDTKIQHLQLKSYGVEVYNSSSAKETQKAINEISVLLKNYKVVVHIDESDFATGRNQNLEPLYTFCKNVGKSRLLMRLYSATNEEAKKSAFAKNILEVEQLQFNPPDDLYRGAKWFVENNLVFESKDFSDQKDEVINYFLSTNKALGILRITGQDENDDTKIKILEQDMNFINDLLDKNIECHFVYDNKDFIWEQTKDKNGKILSPSWKKLVYDFQKNGRRHIIILNQKAVRSTELHCHKHLSFLHDNRSENTPHSTIHQAAGRVFHYKQNAQDKENEIRVYTSKEVFEYAAGKISLEECERKLSARITTNYRYKRTIVLYNSLDQVEDKYKKNKDSSGKLFGKKTGTVSGNNAHDICSVLLGKLPTKQIEVYLVDKQNKNFQNSWNDLINKIPDIQGKYARISERTVDTAEAKTNNKSIYS